MKNKNMWLIALGAVLILVAGITIGNFLTKNRQEETGANEARIAATDSKREARKKSGSKREQMPKNTGANASKLIRVSSPKAGATVKSPIAIDGEARGGWYFEASFPVKLTDASGKVLAQGYAQANGEWMTENFVPFSSTLSFTVSKKSKAFLILEKNNASGLPEHDASIKIPLTLLPGGSNKTLTVNAFFGNVKMNPNADCEKAYPAARTIAKTQSTARAALNELLKGPTAEEKAQGYYTSINTGVKVNSLTINSGTAKADFSSNIEKNLGGSCKVTAIRAQIERTLKQFPTVKRVIISVGGKTKDVLQP